MSIDSRVPYAREVTEFVAPIALVTRFIPDGPEHPWRMNDNVKEFHLVAEPVVREIAPGMKPNLWGFNGQSLGTTIEVVEGDRVRIRLGNLTMTKHPMHLHGHSFEVAGTDGRWIPKDAR